MTENVELCLDNFFIYNDTFGPREGEEHKKILYYYPASTDLDTKIKNIGLCEAVVKYVQTFTDGPCEALHTLKKRHLFYQPEINYWMVMTVAVPWSKKAGDTDALACEYREEDVQDLVLSAVLRRTYKVFKLFMDTYEGIMARACGDVDVLKAKLQHFYNRHLLSLKLDQCDMLDVYSGLSFLPLEKGMYLKTQCLINRLEAKFPAVKHTMLLYHDHLVWSGIEQDDADVLYQCLTTNLLPAHLEQEMTTSASMMFAGSSPARNRNSGLLPFNASDYGKFIVGPSNLRSAQDVESSSNSVPHVFLTGTADSTPSIIEECRLLVYKSLGIVVCLLVDVLCDLNADFFCDLHMSLEQPLMDLADQYLKRPISISTEPQLRYIYFNQMNRAVKTTIHSDMRKLRPAGIPMDTLRLIADLQVDLSMFPDDSEVIVKSSGSSNDFWVVGKKSDSRQLFVIVNQKNANLVDISDEVNRLCSAHFSNMFFMD